jgi:short subunit dehydrogenase-like uncharacterized protein
VATNPEQTAPIAVYGATGYTGRLVARELSRRGLPSVLSGRNESKLEQLAAGLDGDFAVKAARVDDPRSLASLLEDCAALINCAGPFSLLGEPVVAAAIAAGTHYVDTTGEQTFMKRVFDGYEARAGAAGVAVVPAMGFDYVPGDMLARLVADGLEPLDSLTIAYAVRGMRASRGTMLSALEIMKGSQLTYVDGDWRPAPALLSTQKYQFPEPAGNQAVVPFPSGEILTVPRHTRTRQVSCLMSTSTFAPQQLGPALPLLTRATGLAARTPLKALIDRGIARLPEGPTEQQRSQASFTVVAEARSSAEQRRGVIRGSDPYGLTAVTAVEGAMRMAAPGYDRKGVLAPAQAFDAGPFLDALGGSSVSYELPPLPTAGARH